MMLSPEEGIHPRRQKFLGATSVGADLPRKCKKLRLVAMNLRAKLESLKVDGRIRRNS